MKKNLFILCLAVCLSCGLCACNSESSDQAASVSASGDENNNDTEKPDESVPESKDEVSEPVAEESSKEEQPEPVKELSQFEKLFENGPIPAKNDNELWGYLDNTGNYVIEPVFADAKAFRSNGLALVLDADTNLWGMIDASGSYIVEPKFSKLGNYFSSELLPAVIDDRGWGYINEQGEFVIEPQFSVAYDFLGGFARVSSQIEFGTDDQYSYYLMGYIDTSGERITEDIFSEAYNFSEGLACVKQGDIYDGSYGYIDETGAFVIEPLYSDATSFYSGVAFVDMWADGMKYYGLIDKNGTAITGPICGGSGVANGGTVYFSNGLQFVKAMDGIGKICINTKGEVILPKDGSTYGDASAFINGYAVVAEQDTLIYGYIDEDGNWLLSPRYGKATSFSQDGLAYVIELNGDAETGFTQTPQIIDTFGNCVFEAAVLDYSVDSERTAVTIPNGDGNPSKIGFWSANDGLVIDYIFDETTGFVGDYSYAKVKYNGLWGMIDKDGNWLIPAKFMAISG